MAQALIVKPEEVADTGARWLADAARAALMARGRADIALSGGNTPKPIYENLAKMELPWKQIHFWFADERCVPPDAPDSNFLMADNALFSKVTAHVHRMEGERKDREAAAADYATALPDFLDAILLGMGEDLHTCSLFPGKDWSKPVGKKVIYVDDSPKPPPERLTITPDVLAAAGALIVVVTGASKADQVAKALGGPARPDLYPIHLARRATWLLDTGAAAKLDE